MTPSISEILNKCSQLKGKDERVEFLKRWGTKPVQDVLKVAFDPNIKWLLPEGKPPYKPNEDNINTHNVLMHETRKFYLWVEGYSPTNLSQTKREQLFIELLETVHPDDAVLLIAAKDKSLPYKGITASIVKEAFPGLLP